MSDLQRALDFYLEKLGFEKRCDFPYSRGLRWVEVAPAGSTNRIALVASEGNVGKDVQTHCALTTDDIDFAHMTLRAKGVEVSEVARVGRCRSGLFSDDVRVSDAVPPQFYFHDVDGNRFLIVQSS